MSMIYFFDTFSRIHLGTIRDIFIVLDRLCLPRKEKIIVLMLLVFVLRRIIRLTYVLKCE